MRLLHGLGQHMPQRILKVFAAVLAGTVRKHREDCLHGLVEHGALVFHGALERLKLGNGGSLAHAELDAPVAQEVEHGDALCDADGMIGGELENAVTQANVLGALTGGSQERLRRWAVGVFFEEVVLNHPGVVVACAIGELQLRQRVVIELELAVLLPGPRQLQLVENAELHRLASTQSSRAAGSIAALVCSCICFLSTTARLNVRATRSGWPCLPTAFGVGRLSVGKNEASPRGQLPSLALPDPVRPL